MKKMIAMASVLALFLSVGASAGKIQSLKVSVTGSDGNYTSHTKAKIKGNYERYVKRMLNIEKYPKMGVPNMVKNKRIGKNKSYIHMKVFFRDSKYYTQSNTNIGAKKTTVNFKLIPKAGPYPVKHNYQSLRGATVVEVISGTPKDGVFTVSTITKVKLKPGASTMGVKSVMKKIARGTVKALAK